MMKRLQHLTSIECDKITILQGEGLSIRKIAKELGRSPSTISREYTKIMENDQKELEQEKIFLIDISERPIEADNRTEFGHFEADSIESCKIKGQQLSCLTVVVERVSRFVSIRKTASKTANATTKSIIFALNPFKNNINSITYDNGCEFSLHESYYVC